MQSAAESAKLQCWAGQSSESASAALIAAATDNEVRPGQFLKPSRLCESLLLGHVSSEDSLVDLFKEEFGVRVSHSLFWTGELTMDLKRISRVFSI